MKKTNELIAGFRIELLHLLSTGSSPVKSLMWSRQENDYNQILCLSLVCHQDTDLHRSPRETLLPLSFPGNDAIFLSLQKITPRL
jgi:hypothetical protein